MGPFDFLFSALGVNQSDPFGFGASQRLPRTPGSVEETNLAPPTDPSAPASIRFNNPGAQYPGPIARRWGSTRTETIGDGHQIAVFDDPENGAAAMFDLLRGPGYAGKTLADAIKKWSGGNNSDAYVASITRETGLRPDYVLSPETMADPRRAIPLVRSMARMEAGRDSPITDAVWSRAHARVFGGDVPPTATATTTTQPPPTAQPRTAPQPRQGRNAMPGVFDFLFNGGGGAAQTGNVDILDALGIGSGGRSRFAQEQGATERTRMALDAHGRTAAATAAGSRAEQDAMRLLTQRFQELQGQSGDLNLAINRLIVDPAFAEANALSGEGVNRFLTQLRTMAQSPADPGAIVRSQLDAATGGAPALPPGVAEGGMDIDRGAQPRGVFAGMTPEQRAALEASSRIAPQGAATAAATALNARAFPPTPEPPARNPQFDRVAATRLGAIQTAGDEAEEQLQTIGGLRTAMANFQGGTGFRSGIRAYLGQRGINVEGASDAQVAQAFINRLLPAQRQGLPGAVSDRDMQTFRDGLVKFVNTNGANAAILDNLEALQNRNVAQGRLAQRVFAGELTPQQAFSQMGNPPDPRHAEFHAATGEDLAALKGMTDVQLLAETKRLVERFGHPLPPLVAAAIQAERQRINRALGR